MDFSRVALAGEDRAFLDELREFLRTQVTDEEMFGRVAIAQTMRDLAPELMDMLGAAASLPVDTGGSVDDGRAEYLFRLALPTGIYGGTLDVFRNMIARHALGLR